METIFNSALGQLALFPLLLLVGTPFTRWREGDRFDGQSFYKTFSGVFIMLYAYFSMATGVFQWGIIFPLIVFICTLDFVYEPSAMLLSELDRATTYASEEPLS